LAGCFGFIPGMVRGQALGEAKADGGVLKNAADGRRSRRKTGRSHRGMRLNHGDLGMLHLKLGM
ncbi:MAG: hypothetical protein LBU47_06355, partial [Christensenellaceae bacterium]|nr:hypothetical protein [Christensenellaceae bacterium]